MLCWVLHLLQDRGKTLTNDGLYLMKRITRFAAFATFAFLVGSSTAIAEPSSGTGQVPLNAARGQAAAPVMNPIQKNQIRPQIRPAPAPGTMSAGQGAPQLQAPNDHPALKRAKHPPTNAVQQIRRPAVDRGVARRIDIAGGVLVLPKVGYYGVPVILDVPQLGYVDVPEDEYARLYDKLSSSDAQQVEEAMASLQRLKALEEQEFEAWWRGPERTKPEDTQDLSTQDLSEPIFFDLPSRSETRRRRLY